MLVLASLVFVLVGCDTFERRVPSVDQERQLVETKHKHAIELKREELASRRLDFERHKFDVTVEICREHLKRDKNAACHFPSR